MAADTQTELARLAHALWCAEMRRAGWKPGPVFDEEARTHDALVPFGLLHPRDAAAAVRAVSALHIEKELVRAVGYPRGPDRPLVIEEMRVGLPVCGITGGGAAPGDRKATGEHEHGSVESWETDDSGELTVIRVRWSDGQLVEHHPSSRELRRP